MALTRLDITLPDNMPEDSEEVILFLRNLGWNKIRCILALRHKYGLSADEAKKQVHFSSAWEDRREGDDHFHAQLENAATELGWIAKE